MLDEYHAASRFYHVKDTKLKAIHNYYQPSIFDELVGFTMSKIQNWKQFTTCWKDFRQAYRSVLPCQRYKIESNSQPFRQCFPMCRCRFYHVKDTKLKAIHNCAWRIPCCQEVGFTMSKIQNWKQFTTSWIVRHAYELSVLPCQRYKIESNSQQIFEKEYIWCLGVVLPD